jgi:hypothetical protein
VTSLKQQQVWNGSATGWAPVGGVMPFVHNTWGSLALGTGTGRINAIPVNNTLGGGFTRDAEGFVITPARGVYRLSAIIRFTGVGASSQGWCGVGTDAAVFIYGSFGAGIANSAWSVATGLLPLGGGQKVALWYGITAGVSMTDGQMGIEYVSDIN